MGQQVRRVYIGAGQWTQESNKMFNKKGYRCDYNVSRVLNESRQWTHEGNIMFNKEG